MNNIKNLTTIIFVYIKANSGANLIMQSCQTLKLLRITHASLKFFEKLKLIQACLNFCAIFRLV